MSPKFAEDVNCIILAAGKGKRFKTHIPKVLHPVLGKPMIMYILDIVKSLGIKKTYIVCGFKDRLLREALDNKFAVEFIRQRRLLGSGDAVRLAKRKFLNKQTNVLVLYADTPLLSVETIRRLILEHKNKDLSCTLLTAHLANPDGYGRINRNNITANIESIIEDVDAQAQQKNINEVNVGVYCFKSDDLFWSLGKIKTNNVQKEYYLTDVVSVLARQNKPIGSVSVSNTDEVIGINTRDDLTKAVGVMKNRILNNLMASGVTIVDPGSTFIEADVKIGGDTTILPFVVIEKGVKIGNNCTIGPFCRIRQGVTLKDNVQIGNFVELVRSRVDTNTKIRHTSYVGDANIGKFVNIGAGTITANYDGTKKYRTKIQDGAFIGSGTIFVAPVKVGRRAITGAGSVVLKGKDVAADTVVVGVPARVLKREKKRIRRQTDED